jgi:hypothetical protein
VPDPARIITGGPDNKTARTVAIYENEVIKGLGVGGNVRADHRQQSRRRVAQAQGRPR